MGRDREVAMDAESRNLQNDFFNAARKEKSIVTIFLGSGKKLTGRIKSFDKFTLLLDGPYGEQMVFKHAISTVSASARGGFDDGPGRGEGGEGRSPERH
jgi:host factor-I protein